MIKSFTKQPPRYTQDYAFYFLTFYTYQRKKILLKPKIAEFLIDELHFYAKKKLKDLIAYTIQEDHIHLLVEIKLIDDLSDFLRDFKSYTSKQIKKMLSIDSLYIWQRGTMDHYIRLETKTDFDNHFNYIFYNSWKHLKILPKNFPYHNFKEWAGKELFDIDFCDFDEKRIKYRE